MILKKIIESRQKSDGEIICSMILDYGEWESILPRLGLSNNFSALFEIKRDEALDLLSFLLSTHLAYSTKVLEENTAVQYAIEFLDLFPTSSQFYTNALWHKKDSISWTPLAPSTFDGGIIVRNKSLVGSVWFLDED